MTRISTVALVLATSPFLALPALRAQQTGTARPVEAVDNTPAAIVEAAPTPITVASPTAVPAPLDSSPAVTLRHHDLEKFGTTDSPARGADTDGDIVEAAPPNAYELPVGTLLHARLQAAIQTATTAPQTSFTAQLTEPLLNMGRTIVPAGAMLQGHITEIHGGRRFHGAAMIHLQAQSILLPDGSRIPLNAAVIDTDQYGSTRIDDEGSIVRKDHPKETLAELSLTTGAAAAAGGVIAGVPGALVGAGIGAGISTIWWLNQDRQTTLPADTVLILSLTAALPIESLVREAQAQQSPVSQAVPETAPADAAPEPAAVPRYAESFVPSN